MSRNGSIQIPFRLTREHIKRLDKAADACGQTRQAFMQAAVLAEVAEVEERRRMKKLRVSRSSDELLEPQQDVSADADSSPSGTGIADALRRQRDAEVPTPPAAAAQGQVVVNVGSAAGGHGETIERLAAYVAEASDFERDSRKRAVVKILRATASTDEERKTLAARLDEAIAAKVKTGGGVARAARVAFDKLIGMFGDDK